MNKNMNSINIGNSGEYFVAAELERRGFTVGVPMSNVKDYDLLCVNKEGKHFALQVKTTLEGNNKWLLSKKCENIIDDNVFYIFVHLHKLDTPSYYIVPSKYVAETIYKSHRDWLNNPGKNGNAHKDNNLRTITFDNDLFLNKWDYLK